MTRQNNSKGGVLALEIHSGINAAPPSHCDGAVERASLTRQPPHPHIPTTTTTGAQSVGALAATALET